MSFPPLSPEETATPEVFALATAIGTRLSRQGHLISEIEAIALAEDLMEYLSLPAAQTVPNDNLVLLAANSIGHAMEQVCHVSPSREASRAIATHLHQQGMLKVPEVERS